MNSRTRRRLELAMPFIVIVALVVVWQAIVAIFKVRQFVLPRRPPSGPRSSNIASRSSTMRCSPWRTRSPALPSAS